MRNDARPVGADQAEVASHRPPLESQVGSSPHSPVEPTELPERARDTGERKKPFVTDRDPGDEEQSSR
jgi:hypothetical protein